MDTKDIPRAAKAVWRILMDKGCYRDADSVSPPTMTVKKIIKELEKRGFKDISEQDFYKHIKGQCLDEGIVLVSIPGKGHFIGSDGEWVRNDYNVLGQVKGRLKKSRQRVARASERMNLDEGDNFCRGHFSMTIIELYDTLENVGKATKDPLLPLPTVFRKYLEDYYGEDEDDIDPVGEPVAD